MTQSDQSISVSGDLQIVGVDGPAVEPIDVRVRVEPGGRCAYIVLELNEVTSWRLALGPDGAAFLVAPLVVALVDELERRRAYGRAARLNRGGEVRMTDLSPSNSARVVCPLCGAQLRRLVRDGRLGAHRRGDGETQCPARGWKPAYVQDLIDREDVADVEGALR